jgi:hypothetical protein
MNAPFARATWTGSGGLRVESGCTAGSTALAVSNHGRLTPPDVPSIVSRGLVQLVFGIAATGLVGRIAKTLDSLLDLVVLPVKGVFIDAVFVEGALVVDALVVVFVLAIAKARTVAVEECVGRVFGGHVRLGSWAVEGLAAPRTTVLTGDAERQRPDRNQYGGSACAAGP